MDAKSVTNQCAGQNVSRPIIRSKIFVLKEGEFYSANLTLQVDNRKQLYIILVTGHMFIILYSFVV
jgi:hypothetical protein